LVETDAAKKFDLIITVEASQEQRENRLLARGLLASEIKARMASQVDDMKRREIADLVIENTGDLAELSASVEKIWENELLPRK
jgi:dephospho-CoA kinase